MGGARRGRRARATSPERSGPCGHRRRRRSARSPSASLWPCRPATPADPAPSPGGAAGWRSGWAGRSRSSTARAGCRPGRSRPIREVVVLAYLTLLQHVHARLLDVDLAHVEFAEQEDPLSASIRRCPQPGTANSVVVIVPSRTVGMPPMSDFSLWARTTDSRWRFEAVA